MDNLNFQLSFNTIIWYDVGFWYRRPGFLLGNRNFC